MSYFLDKPLVVDRYTIATVSWQAVGAHMVGRQGVALQCSKAPVYVVVRDRLGKAVLDMSGAEVPLEEAISVCPAIAML